MSNVSHYYLSEGESITLIFDVLFDSWPNPVDNVEGWQRFFNVIDKTCLDNAFNIDAFENRRRDNFFQRINILWQWGLQKLPSSKPGVKFHNTSDLHLCCKGESVSIVPYQPQYQLHWRVRCDRVHCLPLTWGFKGYLSMVNEKHYQRSCYWSCEQRLVNFRYQLDSFPLHELLVFASLFQKLDPKHLSLLNSNRQANENVFLLIQRDKSGYSRNSPIRNRLVFFDNRRYGNRRSFNQSDISSFLI